MTQATPRQKPEGWPASLTRRVGEAVRQAREGRFSAAQLAQALTDIGVRTTRDQISNLEAGYRATIGVHEVVALAAVLGVDPLSLLVPDLADQHVELLPAQETDGVRAVQWWRGAYLPAPVVVGDDAHERYAKATARMDDLLLHDQLVADVTAAMALRRGPDGDDPYLRKVGQLLDLRASLGDRGVYPPLPPELDFLADGEVSDTATTERT